MKVYVLTNCDENQIYPPKVFTNIEAARAELKLQCIAAISPKDYVFDCDIEMDNAYIVYKDDAYDRFNIFEVEV